MTPKEIALRLIEAHKDDEMRYECNAMMFGHRLAKDYLALESRIQKLEAVAEAAKDMAKRHNWTPGMGQCICPQHIAFYKSLAELDQP